MNGMASEKSTLMSALVKAGKNQVLETFREVEQDEEEAGDDSDEEPQATVQEGKMKAGRSKKTRALTATKSKKRTRDERDERDEDTEADPLVGSSEQRSPPAKRPSRSPHPGRWLYSLSIHLHAKNYDTGTDSHPSQTSLVNSTQTTPSNSVSGLQSSTSEVEMTDPQTPPRFTTPTAEHSPDTLNAAALAAIRESLPPPPVWSLDQRPTQTQVDASGLQSGMVMTQLVDRLNASMLFIIVFLSLIKFRTRIPVSPSHEPSPPRFTTPTAEHSPDTLNAAAQAALRESLPPPPLWSLDPHRQAEDVDASGLPCGMDVDPDSGMNASK
jgi:hypothetical protein